MSDDIENQNEAEMVATVQSYISDAKKMAEERKNARNPENASDMSENEVQKTIDDLHEKVEKTRTKGENILSSLEKGLISKDRAKSEMRELLNGYGKEILANMMLYTKINKDVSVTEDMIKDALKKVNERLG